MDKKTWFVYGDYPYAMGIILRFVSILYWRNNLLSKQVVRNFDSRQYFIIANRTTFWADGPMGKTQTQSAVFTRRQLLGQKRAF